MDHTRLATGAGEDGVGIPDDLRCKRSDGKQWRCTALSMPDKTVCEKHYIQAKKRAANSALKASMKKKRKFLGESDSYYESKSDDMDVPSSKVGDYSSPISGKNYKEMLEKSPVEYSPEELSTKDLSVRSSLKPNDDLPRDDDLARKYSPEELSTKDLSARSSLKPNDDLPRDDNLPRDNSLYEDNRRTYRPQQLSTVASSRSRSQKLDDSSPVTDTSEASSEPSASSDDTGRQPCHQCKEIKGDRVVWCLNCDRRGYCDTCISTWYSDISVEEIQKVCPACRGSCRCKLCLRGDNLIKARIRDIPAQDKLQHLYCLLSAVFPIVKQIHREQSSEVELDNRLAGTKDLARRKLNADEQMCCNFCRIPIIDYHRHCPSCSYDLCLSCCKDIREASRIAMKRNTGNHIAVGDDDEECASEQLSLSNSQLNMMKTYSEWRTNEDGIIPCPPKQYGGCGHSILMLKRIFKMNWVAVIVKHVEEMVSGCKVTDSWNENISDYDLRIFQAASREDGNNNNFLYYPSAQYIKAEGIEEFKTHLSRGEPVIVKEVFGISSEEILNPMVILKGISETAEEKLKDENRTVKAINCFDWTEVDIGLSEFMKGYSEGRTDENGQRQMLKLKDWPSPSASEEFLMYQRPDFISKLPLLEFIHSKWGLLNVPAKLPHYSLQNDVGAKFRFYYGPCEELDRNFSRENLHVRMHDMVFLLVHICVVKPLGCERTNIETVREEFVESEGRRQQLSDQQMGLDEGSTKVLTNEQERAEEHQVNLDSGEEETMAGLGTEAVSVGVAETFSSEVVIAGNQTSSESFTAGACWDVFRRQDVPMLIEFLRNHRKDFKMYDSTTKVHHPVFDSVIYLNDHHKKMLKEEHGVEPWSFDQKLGEAVFIPAGCPFQVKSLQSTIQLGLDFLSPESLSEASRLAEEIRGLPNDHDAKLQLLEVGKISLYAASWAIKEVQKLVLDPKLGPEFEFEDPNLTGLVSKNLEEMVKQRQVSCM